VLDEHERMERDDVVVEKEQHVTRRFGRGSVAGDTGAAPVVSRVARRMEHDDAGRPTDAGVADRGTRRVDVAVEADDQLETVVGILLTVERSEKSNKVLATTPARDGDRELGQRV